MPETVDERVLVGRSTSDDAGVYLLREGLALVQTVDFFAPILDDPYQFGRMAATNSLSDVYAMNGKPITALNVMGFPEKDFPISMMGEILRGGAEVCAAAGVAVLGGHTVVDSEPKYGLSVTGVADPAKIWRNVGAKPGDALILTKPIGIGILATAQQKSGNPAPIIEEIIRVTTVLNDTARDAAQDVEIHACTDVTGFGLLGHLFEMLSGSGVGAVLRVRSVPFVNGLFEAIEGGIMPNGTKKNLAFAESRVQFDPEVPQNLRYALADTMTSGGLLFAVAPGDADRLVANLKARGTLAHAVIGEVTEGPGLRVALE